MIRHKFVAARRGLGFGGGVLAVTLVITLAVPLVSLFVSARPEEIARGLSHPLFVPAFLLTLRTTLLSLVFIVLTGTPLAWWLATTNARWARAVELSVELPILIPPAVVGVALLGAYGRTGLLGPLLSSFGIMLPFTEAAVVLAQVVVAAPFYVQAASAAFRTLDFDLLLVGRTLGASPIVAFFRLAMPLSLPGLLAGASIAWARAVGEFGATLLFAGNLPGVTQTMPLSILTALEEDVRLALVFSQVLLLFGLGVLFLIRRLTSRELDSTDHEGRGIA